MYITKALFYSFYHWRKVFCLFIGYAVHVFFWSCIFEVVISFLFSAPYVWPMLETKFFIGTILALDGVALSGTFVPVYLILEHIVLANGYMHSEQSLKLVIGIWINFTMAGNCSAKA